MNFKLAEVAQGVAYCACDVDWLASQVPSLVLRQELKETCQLLHRLARSLAREAGVSIYGEEEDDDPSEKRGREMAGDVDSLTAQALALRCANTERNCLCCGKAFMSEGPHHRLCNACRRKDDYMLFAA